MNGIRWQYYVTHPWKFIKDVYLQIKWFIQRGRRGYADCDLWGFDVYLATVIRDGVKDLKATKHGFPVYLGEEGQDMYFDDVVRLFDLYLKQLESHDIEEARKAPHTGEQACTKLGEHFLSLWD